MTSYSICFIPCYILFWCGYFSISSMQIHGLFHNKAQSYCSSWFARVS